MEPALHWNKHMKTSPVSLILDYLRTVSRVQRYVCMLLVMSYHVQFRPGQVGSAQGVFCCIESHAVLCAAALRCLTHESQARARARSLVALRTERPCDYIFYYMIMLHHINIYLSLSLYIYIYMNIYIYVYIYIYIIHVHYNIISCYIILYYVISYLTSYGSQRQRQR